MTILDEYFIDLLKIYPSIASRLGIKESHETYEDIFSKDFVEQNSSLIKKYINKLKKNRERDDIDYEIVKWILYMYKKRNKTYLYYIPITSYFSSVIDFTFANQTIYITKNNKDTIHLIQRHKLFINRIPFFIKNMEKGIQKNITLPKIICEDLIKLLENYYNNKNYIININTNNKEKYIEYVSNDFAKMILHLINFLKKKYYPNCRDSIGLCSLPNGKKIYNYFIYNHLTFIMHPDKIHKTGLCEVDRIVKQINTLKMELGYSNNLTLQEFNKRMIDDLQNYYKDVNEVLYAFKNMQDYINRKVIPFNFFTNVEDYEIEAVPSYIEKNNAMAFYFPGTIIDNSRKGKVYINTRDLNEIPKYEVMSLSAHEGKPGHHYQFQYMKENNISKSRQYAIHNTTFIEGWALYAESLIDYSDKPYHYFGKLTNELLRSVRLVVDTGIHYYNWSYNQAIDYMTKYLAINKSAIESEVKRYICIPAQALCYKIGEIEIIKLRTKFFNKFKKCSESDKKNNELLIKSFHELLLSEGIIPIELIKDKFSKIIKNGIF